MFLAEDFLFHITHSKTDLSVPSAILADLFADLGSCTPVGFRGCVPAIIIPILADYFLN
jgi:hypothetical protein